MLLGRCKSMLSFIDFMLNIIGFDKPRYYYYGYQHSIVVWWYYTNYNTILLWYYNSLFSNN